MNNFLLIVGLITYMTSIWFFVKSIENVDTTDDNLEK